tara:strand:- start:651 stop:1988 length:1338 start_codon:yes stop_codon:yes gene_type:complete
VKQIRFPLIPSILLNYLLLNFWLVKNDNSNISNYDSWIFENTSAWFLLLLVNVVFITLLLLGKIRLNNDVNYYISVIGIFQFLNIRNISSNYFWESVPDSITYRLLGESFFSCFKLAISCDSPPLLQWPLGQPLISGFLSKYFYETAKYFYLIMFLLAVYFITKLAKKHFGKYFIVGIAYFIFMPNNYELSSFIISETPYLLFTSGTIYFLDKKNYKTAFVFAVSGFFVRPIAVVNLFIFYLFIFSKKRSVFLKYIIVLLAVCLLVMSYNFVYNDAFLISTTISTNIEGDGFNPSDSNFEYSVSLFQNENFDNVFNNISRLYGEGSRNCVFSYCFIYNPLFKPDGTVPNNLNNNSIMGIIFNFLSIQIFKIISPLGIWVYVPFLFLLTINKAKLISNLVLLGFILNILLSVLTYEYGSRWWLVPNLLSIYLLPSFLHNFFNLIKN